MSAVGFVGLGAMGGPIAGRLLAAGHELHGTNRTPAKAQPLIEHGLTWHATPREVAAASDVVAATANEILAKASELGYGERDIADLHEVLARLAGAALSRP
jgi:prephenate dehydrogenase